MSRLIDNSKKIAALGVAGAIGTGAIVAGTHNQENNKTDEVLTESFVEYIDAIPSNNNEFTIGSQVFVVSEPTTGIFGTVTQTNVTTTNRIPETNTSETLENDYEFVLPSRFEEIGDLYTHYENVWQSRSMGKSALQIISEVDNTDKELSIAAALQYLKQMGKDPLEYLHQLKLTQVACLTSVVDANLAEQLKPLISLFPKGYEYMVVKSYVRLANEFTAIIDVKNGVKAIVFDDMVYLTPEVIKLAEGFGIILDEDLVIFVQSQNDIEIKVRK